MNLFPFYVGLCVLAVAILLENFSDVNLQLVDNLHWTICYTCGAISAWFGIRDAGKWRIVRILLASGATAHALGQYVWDIQLFYDAIEFPGPSDILFITNGIFAFAASIVSLYTINFFESRKTILVDGLSISLILIMFILTMYMPNRGSYSNLQLLTFVGYPLFSLSAFSLFLMLTLSNDNVFSLDKLAFLIGCLGFGIVWLEWNDLFLSNRLKDGMLLGYGFSATSLLFGYGSSKWKLEENLEPNIYNRAFRFFPVFKISIVSLFFLYVWTNSDFDTLLKIIVGVGTVLVIFFGSIRQMILIQEKVFAEAKLLVLNRQQEEIILSRTSELIGINISLNQAIQDLKETQAHLIQSEKLASLGQLIGSIAHEINTPLGAIHSSNGIIKSMLNEQFESALLFFKNLNENETRCWIQIFKIGLNSKQKFDPKENREQVKRILPLFNGKNLNAKYLAELMVDLSFDAESIPKSLFQLEDDKITKIVETVKTFLDIARAHHIISESVDRSSKVIRSLKTYLHQSDSNIMEFTNLREQLENLVFLYYKKYLNTVKISLNIPSEMEIECYADELSQIWTNLFNNSLYAFEYKGEIQITAVDKDGWIEIKYSDNGPGISDEIQSKVFEAFFTTKKVGEGTGLGLAITKSIIERHRGTIKLFSSEKGTSFLIRIPKSQKNAVS